MKKRYPKPYKKRPTPKPRLTIELSSQSQCKGPACSGCFWCTDAQGNPAPTIMGACPNA